MKSLRLNRYGLSVCVVAAMLAGCGGGSDTPPSPSIAALTAERTRPVTYSVLYSFAGSGEGDGEIPEATLINVKGTLYGTTIEGGTDGYGTVFSIAPSGTETVLHSFASSGDGAYPEATLIDVKGTLYGTTMEGGANSFGTVFSITPSGKEKMLQGFGSSRDGAYPVAGLINAKDTLYGTTLKGGANCSSSGGCGTVFAVTPSGKETVIYSFYSVSGDGYAPYAGLLNVKGTLYGTTEFGGARKVGTIFSITPSGKESLVHIFGGSGDGGYPEAGLLNVKGTLYGTTSGGGANNYGMVFSLKL